MLGQTGPATPSDDWTKFTRTSVLLEGKRKFGKGESSTDACCQNKKNNTLSIIFGSTKCLGSAVRPVRRNPTIKLACLLTATLRVLLSPQMCISGSVITGNKVLANMTWWCLLVLLYFHLCQHSPQQPPYCLRNAQANPVVVPAA